MSHKNTFKKELRESYKSYKLSKFEYMLLLLMYRMLYEDGFSNEARHDREFNFPDDPVDPEP